MQHHQQDGFPPHRTQAENVNGTSTVQPQCLVREQDRFMPIANVIRIMRKVLPAHAKISDDAKETIQECVSEYISFITSEANDRCQREQRKTITAEDVLWAMNKLGFDDYVEPLTLYLHRYREIEGDHRGSIRGEPLPPPLKRTVSAPPSSLQYFLPPQLHHPHPLTATAIYGDTYFLNLYTGGAPTDGDGAGQSSSSHTSPHGVPPNYDPYAPFK